MSSGENGIPGTGPNMSNPADGIEAALRVALSGGEAQTVLQHERGAVVAVAPGRQIVDLAPYVEKRLDKPLARTGTATLTTIQSFCDHVERFREAGRSAVFVDDEHERPSMVAVYDYHQPAPLDPAWMRHRATYAFPLSAEWLAWREAEDTPMTQADFAAFLEERAGDVLAPPETGPAADLARRLDLRLAGPSTLIALARSLSIRANVTATQAVDLSTGESTIAYEETHAAQSGTAPVKVPGAFAIGVPVFRGGARYQIAVRLRYRLVGGKVTWTIGIHGADAVLDDAIGEAVDRVREKGVPVFFGKPEQ